MEAERSDSRERPKFATRVEDEDLYQEEWQDRDPLHLSREYGHEDQIRGDGVHEAVQKLHHAGGGKGGGLPEGQI